MDVVLAYWNYYIPQRSWGKVMFLQVSVILLTGGCLPQCMLGYPPGADTPLDQVHPARPGTPPGSRHPPDQVQPLDQVHPQTRHTHPPPNFFCIFLHFFFFFFFLLFCIFCIFLLFFPFFLKIFNQLFHHLFPPGAVHAGRYGQQAGGMHPTGMHSCHQNMIHLEAIS